MSIRAIVPAFRRLSLFALAALATTALSAGAQTAPSLLPYTAKLIAGGSSTSYSAYTATNPVACSRTNSSGTVQSASGNYATDKYGDGCLATEIALTGPRYAIADKSGAVFFSDYTNGLIRRVDPTTGIVTAVAGGASATPTSNNPCVTGSTTPVSTDALGDGCLGTQVKLGKPAGIAFDANGNLYFADPYNYNIRKIAATNGLVPATGGTITLVDGELGGSNTSTYGYEANNGSQTACSGTNCIVAATQGALRAPYGIAIDPSGNLYVPDEYYYVLLDINTSAVTNTVDGISIPAGTVGKIAGAGSANATLCVNGTTSSSGCQSGSYVGGASANASYLYDPWATTFDPSGNIYVSPEYNDNIAKITPAGIISDFAGIQGSLGKNLANTKRGTAGSFAIGGSLGLSGDTLGNVYIPDETNGFVWRVDGTSNSMYVVAGGGTVCSTVIDAYGDGCPALQATFGASETYGSNTTLGLYGANIDQYADLFVGDASNNLVREVASGTQFGNIGAQQTDSIDVHFAAGDGPLSSGAYTITLGANIFTIGTASCTTNNDNNASAGNTTDCIIPITAVPLAAGAFSGTLTVKSTLVPAGTNFPLTGNFVQSPVTRTVVSVTGSGGCSGTTYASNTSLTLTAQLTANGPSAPAGTITFYANGNSIGSTALVNIGTTAAPVYGAIFPYSFPNTGTYAVTAVYTPSTPSYFTGSTSSASNVTIVTPTFTIASTGYSQSTVTAGQTALYSFNINQTAFTGTITFLVTGLPANSTYTISPTSLTGVGCIVSNTAALSILTQQQTTVQPGGFGGTGRGRWQLLSMAAGLGLALLIGLRRRRVPMRYGQLMMALALLLGLSGTLACGKATGTVLQPATPSGSYTITVTAASYSGTTLVGSSQVTVPLVVN